jgi:hypothetical protein
MTLLVSVETIPLLYYAQLFAQMTLVWVILQNKLLLLGNDSRLDHTANFLCTAKISGSDIFQSGVNDLKSFHENS